MATAAAVKSIKDFVFEWEGKDRNGKVGRGEMRAAGEAAYRSLLGDNLHWQNREAWIWSKNVYTRYPFQGALYGLPADVLKECIVGAIEARLDGFYACSFSSRTIVYKGMLTTQQLAEDVHWIVMVGVPAKSILAPM